MKDRGKDRSERKIRKKSSVANGQLLENQKIIEIGRKVLDHTL